jgi:carbamoyltransferase
VLEERGSDYFELQGTSPYMLLVAPVKANRRKPMDLSGFDTGDDDLLAVVRQARSDIPAVTHFDYSARVQTVSRDSHPEFHAVLAAFERLTGCAVLVNTSFNVRGEPIVCSPQDAYRCFMRTEMDVLVLEDCLLVKGKQPPMEDDGSWRQAYELD